MRLLTRYAIALLAFTAMFAAVAPFSQADQPIQPDQHFLGLVNGSNTNAIVYTVCPGPISPTRTGPVAGGQHFAVAQVAAGGGYTGPFSQVNAWFVPTSSGTAPQQVKFTTYGTQMAIPSTVRVPCSGTGQVEFSSCPYLAPCAFGWVPNYVAVRFVDIAV